MTTHAAQGYFENSQIQKIKRGKTHTNTQHTKPMTEGGKQTKKIEIPMSMTSSRHYLKEKHSHWTKVVAVFSYCRQNQSES